MYVPRRLPGEDSVDLRGLRTHVWRWAGTDPRPIVLLHGWMDTGQTYQFLVDQLPDDYTFVAPDWRGFGASDRAPGGYWFPDYLADLDALLDVLSPDEPIRLVGHSMGGNIANLYAGTRPERIAKLVSLEGFGLPRTTPDQAPARYREWLDQMRSPGEFPTYPDWDAFIEVIARRQARLDRDRAEFIARAWGEELDSGRIGIRADPAHRRINPVLYRREEAEACWAAIAAPVLWLVGEHTEYFGRVAAEIRNEYLPKLYRDLSVETIPGTAHMLHYERPDLVAQQIRAFFQGA
jgi:pimeloyl-ACP methyl ester carboxylesterase